MVIEDRPRPLAVQTDRAGQDSREPAEVRHARRDDRPQGARSGQHSAAAARRAPLPLRQERLRRRRPGRRRSRPADRPRRRSDGDGTGQAGSDPGQHMLEVDVSLEELAAILADELELPRIEPKGKANIVQDKVTLHQHPPRRAGIAAALQAHLHGGAAPADFGRSRTTSAIRGSCRSAKTGATARGRRFTSRRPTR